jgi:hypothetical protein
MASYFAANKTETKQNPSCAHTLHSTKSFLSHRIPHQLQPQHPPEVKVKTVFIVIERKQLSLPPLCLSIY